MKSVSTALQTHFGLDCTTLAKLWKITRQDGTVLGFTDHDQDITYSGLLYMAATGFTPTNREGKADMSVDNMEVTAFLDSDAIDEADLRAGLYDFADIEIRVVNWADLTMGDLKLSKGTIGTVKMMNGLFQAEIRGLTQYLTTVIGDTYGPNCRADLGDTKCKVDLTVYQQSGTVVSSADPRTIVPTSGLLMVGSSTPTAAAGAGWFNDGTITFTSGVLNNYTFEVKTWDGTTLTLYLNMPQQPAASDAFTITPGCDKTTGQSGCGKFSNIVNFRGEPFIPGMDAVLTYPDAVN